MKRFFSYVIAASFFHNVSFSYNPEHLRLFKETGNGKNADLSGAILRNFNTKETMEIDLTNANLKGAVVANSSLQYAKVSEKTDFSETKFDNTNLNGVRIYETKHEGINIACTDDKELKMLKEKHEQRMGSAVTGTFISLVVFAYYCVYTKL